MRTSAVLLLAGLSACASSHVTPARPAQETVRVMGGSGGSGSLRMAPSADPATTRIALPLATAWKVLPATYDALGIGITTIDPKTYVVANEGVKVRKALGDAPLSQYIDCGTTQIGPNADSYDIYLVIITQLKSEGEYATNVITSVEAAGRPIAFPGDYSRCRTKGTLEKRIAELTTVRGRP